jgi:hypothetical protein
MELGAACHNLGIVYAEGIGTAVDPARAASYWQRACTYGHGGACQRLKGAQNEGEVVAALRRGCDEKKGDACRELGSRYLGGRGVDKDEARAAVALRVACEQKFAEGCNNLGVLYQRGAGVDPDFAEARRLYRLACDGADGQGCVNLGIMLRNDGDGKGALPYFEKGCSAGIVRGCALVGVMIAGGETGARDPARAATLLTQACKGGDESACAFLEATPELKR